MNNKIKQASQVPRGRLNFSRNLNAKSKLTVFTVHKLIEKMGEIEINKATSDHMFTNLLPASTINRVYNEHQFLPKRQTPMIYTSNKKIETMFSQSKTRLKVQAEVCSQVEKVLKKLNKRNRECKTIQGDRYTDFNKNFAQKMKFMGKKVEKPQSYSYDSLNMMNFGLNIKQIKSVHLNEIRRQKMKGKNYNPKQSQKKLQSIKNNINNCQTQPSSSQFIQLESLNQKDLIIKQLNGPKQNKKARIKSKLKDVSSLYKKINRMFNCFDLILNSFHVRLVNQKRDSTQFSIKYQQSTNRTFYQKRKTKLKYTYFIGAGNNSNLIRSILRKRSWWTEVDNLTSAQLVWTQLRQEAVIDKMQGVSDNWNNDNIFYQEQICEERENLSSIRASCKKSNSTVASEIVSLKQTCSKYLFHEKHHKKYYSVLDYNQAMLRLQKIEKPQIIHNHYSHNYMFGNKNALYYNISNYYDFCKKNLSKIVPMTFYIEKGNAKAMTQFQKVYNDPKFKGCIWIMKPAENSNRGQGIQVTNTLNMIKNKLKSQKKLIVQYYIRNLLLYCNRKFDIRTYIIALTVNGRMKIFWYDEGYIRTSSQLYDSQNLADSFIHLTNDAVQKNSENYGKYEAGNKLSYSQFQRYLETKHPRDGWQMNQLHSQMKQLAREASKAIYSRLNPSNKAFVFQLFGLDFIIDNQFKPYLIQINTNPCLELSSPVLQRLIPRMVENMFRLCVDPIFRPQFDFAYTKSQSYYIYDQTFLQRNKFSLIFDQKFDRNFEWEQRCQKMRGLQWSNTEQEQFQDEGNIIVVDY